MIKTALNPHTLNRHEVNMLQVISSQASFHIYMENIPSCMYIQVYSYLVGVVVTVANHSLHPV